MSDRAEFGLRWLEHPDAAICAEADQTTLRKDSQLAFYPSLPRYLLPELLSPRLSRPVPTSIV